MTKYKIKQDSNPYYMQIAKDIAYQITIGEFIDNDKISGCSGLASRYRVSPETVRKALCILSDAGVVSQKKGSGTYIRSTKNANLFLKKLDEGKTLESIRKDISESIKKQKAEMDNLLDTINELTIATEHFRSMNPLMPYAINITSDCVFLDKTIKDIRLWQYTGATLVAIKRQEELIRSPGPYAILKENDILYFVTSNDSDYNIKKYLYNKAI